ncbi:unnamed protein product [Heterobilharzia americana]|nr:unnamed protein product [Heterobilharzia americana]
MEPPPRLYTYEGLFSESRSLDLTLKILSTLLSFLVFLIAVAWHITKKVSDYSCLVSVSEYHTNPPVDKRLNFQSFDDLCKNGAFCLTSSSASRKQKSPIVRGYLNDQRVLFIEDWKVIILYSQSPLLDLHYSLAPKSFRRKWYGLMIADDTLQFRSELNELVILAFNALPIKTFERIGHLAADPKAFGSVLISNDCATFNERLDKWICNIYSEIFFFGPSEVFYEFAPDSTSYLQKEKFISQLREHITSLELLHTRGYCKNASNVFKTVRSLLNTTSSYDGNKLITVFHNLINPLIHYYLEKYLSSEEQYARRSNDHHSDQITESNNNDDDDVEHSQRNTKSTNLLLQLISTYHVLKEEGSSSEFLTLTHIIHVLSECCLLTRYTLNKTLKVLLKILAVKPKWQHNIRRECRQFLQMRYDQTKLDSLSCNHYPSYLCMSLKHTQCLVYTKALIQETLRLCLLGWPFGCLRQALRDGEIMGQDFGEGELVLFDEPSYYSDSDLWTTNVSNDANGETCMEIKLIKYLTRNVLLKSYQMKTQVCKS